MINKVTALKIMFYLLGSLLVFHLLVLIQIIPYDIVWAGKIKNTQELYAFESVSILINASMLFVLYLKFKNIKNNASNKLVNGIIWGFVGLFALNTIGNLFAEAVLEQVLGTFLTLVSAVLCWIIASKKTPSF